MSITVERTKQVATVEQEQIESAMQKKNLTKQTLVHGTQLQIYCHFCPTRTEIIGKDHFYNFPDGKSVFFCNAQEKELWLKLHKLIS